MIILSFQGYQAPRVTQVQLVHLVQMVFLPLLETLGAQDFRDPQDHLGRRDVLDLLAPKDLQELQDQVAHVTASHFQTSHPENGVTSVCKCIME